MGPNLFLELAGELSLECLPVRSIFCGAYLLHRVLLNAKLPESVSPPNEALLLRVCLSGQFLWCVFPAPWFLNAKLPESVTPPNEALLLARLSVRSIF